MTYIELHVQESINTKIPPETGGILKRRSISTLRPGYDVVMTW